MDNIILVLCMFISINFIIIDFNIILNNYFRYFNGNGVEINMNEAFKYYKLSADQGNSRGQYNLGLMYVYFN